MERQIPARNAHEYAIALRACGYLFGLFLGQQLPNDIPPFLILLLFKELSIVADILIVNEAIHGVYSDTHRTGAAAKTVTDESSNHDTVNP